MKKGEKSWLHLCNRMLSGGLVLLGFSACKNDGEPACEYGQPYCSFELKGKVKDELLQPVDGARIIVKELGEDGKSIAYSHPDTLYTTNDGDYDFVNKQAYGNNKYRIVCEDPSDTYKSDSTDVKIEPKGGKGWYDGNDTKEINFELKKKHG